MERCFGWGHPYKNYGTDSQDLIDERDNQLRDTDCSNNDHVDKLRWYNLWNNLCYCKCDDNVAGNLNKDCLVNLYFVLRNNSEHRDDNDN